MQKARGGVLSILALLLTGFSASADLSGSLLYKSDAQIAEQYAVLHAPDANPPGTFYIRVEPSGQGGSLFQNPSNGGLFAPVRGRERPDADGFTSFVVGHPIVAQVASVRHLIAQAEAGQMGYDAVQHKARIKPPKPPTSMTIAEIFYWIRATPGQPHAIGRYQFIPDTLARLVGYLGLSPDTVFTSDIQDRLADVLLVEAGFNAFVNGELSRAAFMNNLAKIWAGLPTTSGKSYYHGYAGNRATISLATFEAEMARIFPKGQE